MFQCTISIERPEEEAQCFLCYSINIGYFPDPKLCWCLGAPVSLLSLPPVVLGYKLCNHAEVSSSFGDLDSGLHVCATTLLPTRPSLYPKLHVFMRPDIEECFFLYLMY